MLVITFIRRKIPVEATDKKIIMNSTANLGVPLAYFFFSYSFLHVKIQLNMHFGLREGSFKAAWCLQLLLQSVGTFGLWQALLEYPI